MSHAMITPHTHSHNDLKVTVHNSNFLFIRSCSHLMNALQEHTMTKALTNRCVVLTIDLLLWVDKLIHTT